jgi:hypothetical protein
VTKESKESEDLPMPGGDDGSDCPSPGPEIMSGEEESGFYQNDQINIDSPPNNDFSEEKTGEDLDHQPTVSSAQKHQKTPKGNDSSSFIVEDYAGTGGATNVNPLRS